MFASLISFYCVKILAQNLKAPVTHFHVILDYYWLLTFLITDIQTLKLMSLTHFTKIGSLIIIVITCILVPCKQSFERKLSLQGSVLDDMVRNCFNLHLLIFRIITVTMTDAYFSCYPAGVITNKISCKVR